jgi:hypothetical protein
MRRASQLEAMRAYLDRLATRSQPKIGFDFGLGERVEIGDNIGPGALATEVGDALLQLLLEDEGEEAAGHVTANGLIDFVEDRLWTAIRTRV